MILPRLAAVLFACQVHLVPQGELDQVRAAQPGIDLLCGSRQPAAGIVGNQQQKILSKQPFAQAVGVVLVAVSVLAIWLPWLLPGLHASVMPPM